jgi:hypothetical protein
MTIDGLEIVSAVFAILAAALWLVSSRVKTPREFPIKIISWHIYDGEEVTGAQVAGESYGTSENLEVLGTALIKQSRLSSYAARCAAISAFCQAAIAFIHHFFKLTHHRADASRNEVRHPAAAAGISRSTDISALSTHEGSPHRGLFWVCNLLCWRSLSHGHAARSISTLRPAAKVLNLARARNYCIVRSGMSLISSKSSAAPPQITICGVKRTSNRSAVARLLVRS